jgi:4-amino-4-deoxychorismate lyase
MSDRRPPPCVLDGIVRPDGWVTVASDGDVLTHGEGLFESLPVIDGVPKFLSAHVRRLDVGARQLGFGAGPVAEAVRSDVALLGRATGLKTFSLRLTLFREGDAIRRLATAAAMPEDAGFAVTLGLAPPWLNGARTLAGLKTTNYLAPRLAHRDGVRRGWDEILLTHHDGTVLEGTRSSVFIVESGRLVTPPASLPILPSVTRDVILEAARRLSIPAFEEPFPLARLLAADEVFISASVRGLRAATSFEGAPLGRGTPVVTEALRRAYLEAFAADPR